jgi:hypothetical protein
VDVAAALVGATAIVAVDVGCATARVAVGVDCTTASVAVATSGVAEGGARDGISVAARVGRTGVAVDCGAAQALRVTVSNNRKVRVFMVFSPLIHRFSHNETAGCGAISLHPYEPYTALRGRSYYRRM